MDIGLIGGTLYALAFLMFWCAVKLEMRSAEANYKSIDDEFNSQEVRRLAWIWFFCLSTLGFISETIRLNNNLCN